MMEVILLERITRLGQIGDVVKVRPGYARNFLLPQKKALRATDSNKKQFETQRAQIEANNLARRQEAEKVMPKIDGTKVVIIRQASETGHLYGSVGAKDVAQAVTEAGATIDKRQVILDKPIKLLGLHPIRVALHPEVIITVTVNVAKSADEAVAQEKAGGFIPQGDVREARQKPDVDAMLSAVAPEMNAGEEAQA